MAKIRVHELAKELGLENKQLLAHLAEQKIEVKSHMSSLDEAQEKAVRDAFSKDAKAEPAKQTEEGEAASKPTTKKLVRKKKKNIIQVFHPQNAKSREAKNFRGATPSDKPEGRAREQRRDTRPARPLVKVPRAHPPASSYAPKEPGLTPEELAARKAAREQAAREQAQAAKASAQAESQAVRPQAEAEAPKGRPEPRAPKAPAKESTDRRPAREPQKTDRRPQRTDRRPAQAPAADVKTAKLNSRGARSDKDKDKNRKEQRDNRFGGAGRGRRGRQNEQPAQLEKPTRKRVEEKKVEKITEIRIPEKLTIRELAEKMKIQASAIVKKLFMSGMMVTVNQEIDFDKAEEIAMDYDIIAEPEEKVDVIAELLKDEEDKPERMKPRPPVVCVMGHVDHGKTSLLDAIRDTHVTDREAGGITQSIGAYVVEINGQKITFLDTPGHEAFTAMRMRGANSTDIAVLVVAADDGVMPQTVEAINHAKAAGVEIIVAINKIDKPNANVDRVMQELAEYELVPEDWGGSTIFAPVSAKSHEGIDNLLEMILLTAEVLELKADADRKARALVLEAKLDKGKGPVASVLVQKGTLHIGDYIACGAASGRVRAMTDENGRPVKEAGPSRPVEVQGLSDVPNAGEILVVTDTDKEAKSFAATFVNEGRNKLLEETRSRMSLDALFSQIHEGDVQELNIVVKADVQGSVEAVRSSLEKLSNEEVLVKIVHGGVGAINESDVTLAAASNAIIIGFNVNPDPTAKAIAAQEKIDVRLYKVIYKAIEDVEAAMKGMLAPLMEERVTGHAEIRQLFKASGIGTIAGSYVLDGTIQRDCMVRITRGEEKIFEGNLASLKRFKDDVKEVKSGFECGLVFEDFNDVQELDQVEAYIMVEVPRT